MVLLSNHNICFGWEIKKIFANTHSYLEPWNFIEKIIFEPQMTQFRVWTRCVIKGLDCRGIIYLRAFLIKKKRCTQLNHLYHTKIVLIEQAGNSRQNMSGLSWLLSLCMLGNFSCFTCHLRLFFKINFFSKLSREHNTVRVSNSLDPEQDRHSVGPDLGPNCLQRLSADDKSHC